MKWLKWGQQNFTSSCHGWSQNLNYVLTKSMRGLDVHRVLVLAGCLFHHLSRNFAILLWQENLMSNGVGCIFEVEDTLCPFVRITLYTALHVIKLAVNLRQPKLAMNALRRLKKVVQLLRLCKFTPTMFVSNVTDLFVQSKGSPVSNLKSLLQVLEINLVSPFGSDIMALISKVVTSPSTESKVVTSSTEDSYH